MYFVMKLDYKYDKISVISEVQILGNKHGISYQTGEKSYILSLVRYPRIIHIVVMFIISLTFIICRSQRMANGQFEFWILSMQQLLIKTVK